MVTETMEQYASALASQDWDQVAPLIHEDCVAVFSSGTFVGKREVETAFRRIFGLIEDEEYTISDLHWVAQGGDIAVCRYDFAWSGLIAGEPAAGRGRGTSVLKRSDRGWQIVLEHLGPPSP